jgi:hypothetical protein
MEDRVFLVEGDREDPRGCMGFMGRVVQGRQHEKVWDGAYTFLWTNPWLGEISPRERFGR